MCMHTNVTARRLLTQNPSNLTRFSSNLQLPSEPCRSFATSQSTYIKRNPFEQEMVRHQTGKSKSIVLNIFVVKFNHFILQLFDYPINCNHSGFINIINLHVIEFFLCCVLFQHHLLLAWIVFWSAICFVIHLFSLLWCFCVLLDSELNMMPYSIICGNNITKG